MFHVRRSLVAPILALATLLGLAGAVSAYWMITGMGRGSVATSTLDAPAWVNATQPNTDIQTAHVRWATVNGPDGNDPDGFYVLRTQDGVTLPACDSSPDVLISGAATSCDETSVPLGVSTYTVVVVNTSWTAQTTSPALEMVAHALISFTVAPSTTTPTAGVPFTVTITANAADGGVKPDYTGSKCVVFSGPNVSPSGAAPAYPVPGACAGGSSVAFNAGIGTASVTLVAAESVGLRVADATTGLYGTSPTLTVGPAAATALSIARQPATSATAGTTFSRQPKVAIVDAYGNTTASTASVSLAVTNGGATVACTPNPLAATAGVATFTGCAITKAGTWTLTATSGSLNSATTSSIVVSAAAAASLTASSGTPQSAAAGAAFANALVALVADAYGNPVAGVSVTFAAPGSGATATLSGAASASATTGSTGFATSPVPQAGTVAGAYAVTASSTGLTSTSFALTNTPAAASKLFFTTQPSGTATAGVAFGTQPKVTVLDTYGNTVTGSSAAVTLSGGSVSCSANPVSASSGVASFAGCLISQTGSWALTASSGSLTSAGSSSITVSAAGIASIAVSSGGAQSTTVGTAFASPLVAIVKDSYGNPLPGITVTFTAPSSGATAAWSGGATTTAVTNASGLATAGALIANTTSGAYQVSAAAGSTSVNFNLANNAGTPVKILITNQPAASITAHTAFSISAVIADTYGNTVTSVASTSLSLVKSPTTSLTGCSSASTASGIATWTGCMYDVAGTGYTLTASGGGYTAATSTTFAITPAAASAVTVSSGNNQTAKVAVAFTSALAAIVKDAYGNVISGASVTFTAPATGASLKWTTATTTVTTNASGVATTTIPTAGTVSGAYTVTAAVTGATSASFTMTNTVGTATKLVFTQQPAGATATFAFVTQPKVAITDAYGNVVTTASGTITLAITSGTGTAGATLSSCSSMNTSSGVATISNCKINTAGTGYTLRATSGTYTAGTSSAFDVSAVLTVTSVSLVNKTGGTAGTTETGDKMTVTFSAAVRASTMCSAWTTDTAAYSQADAVVSFNNAGNSDTVTVTSATCASGGLKLGTLTVGAYISSTQATTFTASTIAWDPTTRTVTITLGTTAKAIVNTTSFTMSFAVSTSITDPNGRAASGTRTYTGLAF